MGTEDGGCDLQRKKNKFQDSSHFISECVSYVVSTAFSAFVCFYSCFSKLRENSPG